MHVLAQLFIVAMLLIHSLSLELAPLFISLDPRIKNTKSLSKGLKIGINSNDMCYS